MSWTRPFLNPSTINSSRPSINTSLVASWPMPIGIQVFSERLAFKSDNSVNKRTPAFSNKRWSSLAGSEGSRWIQVVHTRPPHVSAINISMDGFHCLSLKKASCPIQKNRKLLAIGSQIKHLSWNQFWPSDTLASGWWNSSTVGPTRAAKSWYRILMASWWVPAWKTISSSSVSKRSTYTSKP